MGSRLHALSTVMGAVAAPLLALGGLARLEAGWVRVDWSDPWGWLGRAPFEDAVGALLRLGGMGVCAWLAGSSLLYLIARVSGVPAAIRVAARMTLPAVRRAADRLVAGALTVATLTASLGAAAAVTGPAEAPTTTRPVVVHAPVAPGYLPVGEVRPAPPSSGPLPPVAGAYLPFRPTGPGAGAPAGVLEVTIRPGDHLWGLAERRLAEVLGRAATDDEVAGYWRSVVAASLPRLRSGDPDLVFPGEVVRLPPVSPPGS